MSSELAARHWGNSTDRPPIVLLHGLFGSAANFGGLTRRLAAAGHHGMSLDLPGHGRSPWQRDLAYAAQAEAVAKALQACDRFVLAGHSMGGKVAMQLACTRAAALVGLVVMDIAPIPYGHQFAGYADILRDLPLDDLVDRAAAEHRLEPAFPEPLLRRFLLANLQRDGKRWRWRIDLDAIAEQADAISDFDSNFAGYKGPTLFLSGEQSAYIGQPEHPLIMRRFPNATIKTIDNAGHWLHADQPDAVARAIDTFAQSLS